LNSEDGKRDEFGIDCTFYVDVPPCFILPQHKFSEAVYDSHIINKTLPRGWRNLNFPISWLIRGVALRNRANLPVTRLAILSPSMDSALDQIAEKCSQQLKAYRILVDRR
jgi:hypothetical protein